MSSNISAVNLSSPFLQELWKDKLDVKQLKIAYYGNHLTN